MQSNFQVQTFSKGSATLEVRVDSRGQESEVRLTPKGMMWDEDDQPSPKDLPLPPDATEVEYDGFFESIEFKSSSDVKTLVSFLTSELEQRNWTKEATEYDLETFVRMKFSHGKSSLEIDVRAEDAGSEVAIRSKGMQWDGMKAEIERSEREKEQREAEKERMEAEAKIQQKADDMQAALQKRRDRPKQGIENLPRLPTEATVTMDGTPYPLPNVVAYEVYEDDEWITKIVATQRPINQASLIARLQKTGSDKDEDDNAMSWPQPFLQITLDAEDRPTRMNLQAAGTPGGGSRSDLVGEALVENGRARGTVELKEPGSFFDKVYTAVISFDVPVLTRDSTAAKRLTDAPRLSNSGKLTIGDKTYQLAHVVAYSMKQFDEPMTRVVASEKPLNMGKLQSVLGRKAADDYFEFVPQVQLLIDPEENITSLSIWADNVSISGNSNLAGEAIIEDGRVRGTARLTEPGEFFDQAYNFEVSFDVDVLGGNISPAPKSGGGPVADTHDGLPFPENHTGIASEASPYRKQISTTVSAQLTAIVDFYRSEFAGGSWGEWKENPAEAMIQSTSAKLVYNGPVGSLVVQLETQEQETAITLVQRDAQAAKAAGVLPASGKARLVVANATDKEAVISINNREYKIAAMAGAQDHKTGLNWEVAPGNYTVEMKLVGKPAHTEKLKLAADETWGVVVIDESGVFLAAQLY